eukprot:gnl/Chilomastix_cuspidata/479.p1 GENE.gnl/Chilomastix_cuspidata/479~~gnl/Chilomastix_cuspidata/479.p1  ORF type:complete len:477 (+),score=198.56 gnl/Chilomastix_cuspidata/479:25-1455(+)
MFSCVLALLALAFQALADTPCNCMSDQVLGTWQFSLSSQDIVRENDQVDCSHFSTEETVQFTLLEPNIVLDENGAVGNWIMHANQGIEVHINGKRYFHFLRWYETSDSTISDCSHEEPSMAWFHDDVVDPELWGCYTAELLDAAESVINVENSYQPPLVSPGAHPHEELVDEINRRFEAGKLSFTARTYERFEDPAYAATFLKGQPVSEASDEASGAPVVPRSARAAHKYLPFPYSETRLTSDLPTAWDWRDISGENFVPDVRDQGGCGSCYTFAATGSMMSRVRISTDNELQPNLSPQHIVSCNQYSQGCDGGLPELAGKFGVDFGVVEESVFPYQEDDTVACEYDTTADRYWFVGANFLGSYYGATNLSATAMMQELVENGPFSVSIYCYDDFSSYDGGIYAHDPDLELLGFYEATSHAVLLVGYGEEDGTPYWIIQNSWGPDWGEDGYIRMLRGTDESAVESKPIPIYYWKKD